MKDLILTATTLDPFIAPTIVDGVWAQPAPARRRIASISGIARPSAALRRQIETLHGRGAKPSLAVVLDDARIINALGATIQCAIAACTVDGHLESLDAAAMIVATYAVQSPQAGVRARCRDGGLITALSARLNGAFERAVRRGGGLNVYEVAEHVIASLRAPRSTINSGIDSFEMSLGDTAESDWLLLLFNNTNWANVGDATGLRGSSTAGSFYTNTHTANPGETGNQTTNVSAYTSYNSVATARSSAGWTISGTAPTQAANAAATTFPACTGGSETETHFSIGRASSSTGEILFYGALTSSLAVSNGITPSFAINSEICTAD